MQALARDGASSAIDRRRFLAGSTALTAVLTMTGMTAAAADLAAPPADVAALAAFLTGKSDLSSEMVRKAYEGLRAQEPGFDQRLAMLGERIRAAGLADVEAFKASALAGEPSLMATATALIGALYTGRVGHDWRGHFVAYQDALMYRPTADVTVVPTYSRRPSGYWAQAVQP
ncbi:MAG TPA: sugar dehydrogenase complex small subunit [Caulobacteraceae bacterium]|nr:sugar dehydrogenase complex small subunit [Caulobacteraceae bacterium]